MLSVHTPGFEFQKKNIFPLKFLCGSYDIHFPSVLPLCVCVWYVHIMHTHMNLQVHMPGPMYKGRQRVQGALLYSLHQDGVCIQPGIGLAASKPQRSFCFCSPQCWCHRNTWSHQSLYLGVWIWTPHIFSQLPPPIFQMSLVGLLSTSLRLPSLLLLLSAIVHTCTQGVMHTSYFASCLWF